MDVELRLGAWECIMSLKVLTKIKVRACVQHSDKGKH